MENYAEIFGQIMWKRVPIMQKKCQIMRKFLKLIKLFPRLFPTYKVHVKGLYDMFDLFQPFVDRYFFIQHSFSPRFLREEWICFRLWNLGKHPKLSNLVTSIQAPHQKMHGMPGG